MINMEEKIMRLNELSEEMKILYVEIFEDLGKKMETLEILKEILSMDFLVRVYGYDMAKKLQTYLKSNDAVKRWLDGKN